MLLPKRLHRIFSSLLDAPKISKLRLNHTGVRGKATDSPVYYSTSHWKATYELRHYFLLDYYFFWHRWMTSAFFVNQQQTYARYAPKSNVNNFDWIDWKSTFLRKRIKTVLQNKKPQLYKIIYNHRFSKPLEITKRHRIPHTRISFLISKLLKVIISTFFWPTSLMYQLFHNQIWFHIALAYVCLTEQWSYDALRKWY